MSIIYATRNPLLWMVYMVQLLNSTCQQWYYRLLGYGTTWMTNLELKQEMYYNLL